MLNDNPLWTTAQAAEFLGFPESTLVRWRKIRLLREQLDGCNEGSPGAIPREEIEEEILKMKGPKMMGPKFIRIGARKVRYKMADILQWAEEPK